jgi:hypothetical protein
VVYNRKAMVVPSKDQAVSSEGPAGPLDLQGAAHQTKLTSASAQGPASKP